MARVSTRVAGITPSATLAVDAKAKALRQAGEPVIGFGAGEPDYPTPAHIIEAAVAACRDERNHHYTPAGGLPELKAAIAAKTARDSGYEVSPSQVVITNGGKHAVFNAFGALLDPGDEVLLPAPYWTTYPEAIGLAGGVPVVVPADATRDFRVTVHQLEAACTDRTKVLLFVSPSNPTGAVYPKEQVAEIGRWAVDRGIWVITDEIYEHLTYDGHEHQSMPVLVPELAGTCVVVNGVAKTYAMTGWRVGWIVAPGDVADACANLQSHQTSNVDNIAQRAALAAVTGPLTDVEMMRASFDGRRRRLHELLDGIDGVKCLLPEGALYAFPSLEGVLGHGLGDTTLELADTVLERAKVAFVPGEAFGAPGYARFSFALGQDDIVEGVSRIAELFSRT